MVQLLAPNHQTPVHKLNYPAAFSFKRFLHLSKRDTKNLCYALLLIFWGLCEFEYISFGVLLLRLFKHTLKRKSLIDLFLTPHTSETVIRDCFEVSILLTVVFVPGPSLLESSQRSRSDQNSFCSRPRFRTQVLQSPA